MKKMIAAAMAMALLAGCGRQTPGPAPEDLMEGVTAREPAPAENITAGGAVAVTDFGVRLLQSCLQEGENTLVSPLSVIEALAMTANGAAGETLEQMESVLGLSVEALNAYLHSYMDDHSEGDGGRVHIANGIWFNADMGFSVQPDFLQANADHYGAGIYQKSFDSGVLDEINAWVAEHTQGRIDQIVDSLSPGAVMYLVNALAFDGTWEEIYRADQVQDGTFTTEDGQTRDVTFMWSTEQMFLQDENATGVVKYYEGRNYAFAALLPKEGMTVAEYAGTLTGPGVQRLLAQASDGYYVNSAIPKFSAEYGGELSKVLAIMGMESAFDPARADFSRISPEVKGELYVNQVMHKTFIRVDEQGTEAGAATAVEVRAAGLLGPEQSVCLDRPFVYMLIDCGENIPLFMGVVADIG